MAKTPTDIRSLARRHTQTALKTLLSIASSEKASDSARVSAATALLDRGWGKPKQELEVSGDIMSEFYAGILGASKAQRVEDDSDSATTH